MNRRAFLATLAACSASPAFAQTASVPGLAPAPADAPKALIYYAGQAGRLTRDRDKRGGNPFASALIDALAAKPATLRAFTSRLASFNQRLSGGWQQMQYPRKLPDWSMDAPGERVALVLMNSDYSKSPGVYSLPGAKVDSRRVPEALEAAGFETTLVLDANAEEATRALEAFVERSSAADAAVIYVGGHGIQHGRTVYWMMGDYPERDPKWLPTHAIALDRIGEAAKARGLNLVLYASCRDDPFDRD